MEAREIKEQIQRQVMEQIPPGVSISDEEMMGLIERQIQGQARENDLRLEVKKSLRRQIYNAIRNMDVIQ